MRKLGYVGIATALAAPKPRQKPARRSAIAVSFPVFHDKSGKRLYRLVMAVLVLISVIGFLAAWMIPAALAPAHPSATNQMTASRANSLLPAIRTMHQALVRGC